MDGEDGMPTWEQVEAVLRRRQRREDLYDWLTIAAAFGLFFLVMWLFA